MGDEGEEAVGAVKELSLDPGLRGGGGGGRGGGGRGVILGVLLFTDEPEGFRKDLVGTLDLLLAQLSQGHLLDVNLRRGCKGRVNCL